MVQPLILKEVSSGLVLQKIRHGLGDKIIMSQKKTCFPINYRITDLAVFG